MEKIAKFFECLIPVTCCNLKCEYCYVHQQQRQLGMMPTFKYSPKQIAAAFDKERMGGACYISICGSGETLLVKEVVDIVAELVKAGHYVNITNNGTVTRELERLISSVDSFLRDRVLLSFSLHYLELKKLGLLSVFAANVKKVHEAGFSIYVKLNLCESYFPVIEEIKSYCSFHFGALPQVAVTRKESAFGFRLYTDASNEEYIKIGEGFRSPRFKIELDSFNRKQTKFCYAGVWSYKADLANGWIKPCYCNGKKIDIFSDITSPLPQHPVGHKCKHRYCVNANIFYPLGVIPGVCDDLSFSDVHDRPEAMWLQPRMKSFLSGKLFEANPRIGNFRRGCYAFSFVVRDLWHKWFKKKV